MAFYVCSDADASHHDLATKAVVARSLAALLDLDYSGECDRHSVPAIKPYVVPSQTLSEPQEIEGLGIRGPHDFFGGVVPHRFVGTKVITHALAHAQATAPAGWSREFGRCTCDAVLPGYSAFTVHDALLGGARLLEHGSLRVKEPAAAGGAGQHVVHRLDELEACLAALDPGALRRDGVVLERNLTQVRTHSIGQVDVGPWQASYVGLQRETRNGRGHVVYGGSTLAVVRGDMESLLEPELAPEVRTAVEQSLAYHRNALRLFRGTFASRCNYDVAQGIDDEGRWHSGVLEQSWRIGGASGAEIAALHAFKADPARQRVNASTAEVYAPEKPPADAHVQFDGVDQHGDRLIKCIQVDHDAHP
ncbi:MAG: DUF3182 family protein [Burkholderiales bacterium]